MNLKELEMTHLNQRGSLLIGLIFTITTIAVLGAGAVYMTSTSTLGEVFENNQARANYLAESGGRYGVPRIGSLPEKNQYTYNLSDGSKFVLNVYTTSAQYSKFDSTGIVNAGTWSEGKKKLTFEVYSSAISGKRCTCRCGS